jgi:hypothetical protein
VPAGLPKDTADVAESAKAVVEFWTVTAPAGAPTTTAPTRVRVSLPEALLTVSDTVYVPGV